MEKIQQINLFETNKLTTKQYKEGLKQKQVYYTVFGEVRYMSIDWNNCKGILNIECLESLKFGLRNQTN